MCNPDRHPSARRQQGVLLVELLIGLTIGMLVATAAIGTLALSRNAASTATELGQLHQQGVHALRMMGRYVRQAGALDIRANAATGGFAQASDFAGLGPQGAAVAGQEGRDGRPDEFSVRQQTASGLSSATQLDCQGGLAKTAHTDSTFLVADANLRCRALKDAQPITDGVADFQVRYRVATAAGMQSMDADQVDAASGWSAVSAIEVCLHLQGDAASHPRSGSHATCQRDGAGRYARASQDGRLHVVMRRVFDLRTSEVRP
jgi:type IV pilus assembly protein PilW